MSMTAEAVAEALAASDDSLTDEEDEPGVNSTEGEPPMDHEEGETAMDSKDGLGPPPREEDERREENDSEPSVEKSLGKRT